MPKKVATELPFNVDAEKAVIGSALINREAANYVTTSLVEEDFYIGKHRLIFRAMLNILNNKHGVVDSNSFILMSSSVTVIESTTPCLLFKILIIALKMRRCLPI